ncbi:3-hydroxyacyl-CoA dehydrogenase (plasmid) [Agrobacterium leguminum]|uniref:3-hydroxyacyl-CoA dehydrogenase n=1 Tax=Agrobacterium leguminum TaxID=2792015 RepID=UPI0030D1A464
MIENILIVGAGLVGSEIGFQCATHGLNVVMYDVVPATLETSRNSHAEFAAHFRATGRVSEQEAGEILARITYEGDLAVAAKDADLVSESVTESLEIKKAAYQNLALHCPPKTIFTTNTSTMLPSDLAEFTGRPNRFLALHVGRPVWDARILEVMPHAGTDPELTEQMVEFAGRIGLVPIRLKKEHAGYVTNSTMVPFVVSGMDLVVHGVASHEDVDRTWMLATNAVMGPCGWADMIGMPTLYVGFTHLAENAGRTELLPLAKFVKEQMLDKGKLGVRNGQGFYNYPDPLFSRKEFLK